MIYNLRRLIFKLDKLRIIDSNTNCWLYTGCISEEGYGLVLFNKKVYPVHRLAAILFLGLDLNDREFNSCHKCNNKNCFNWNHLFIANPFVHKQYDKYKRLGMIYNLDNYNYKDNESTYLELG